MWIQETSRESPPGSLGVGWMVVWLRQERGLSGRVGPWAGDAATDGKTRKCGICAFCFSWLLQKCAAASWSPCCSPVSPGGAALLPSRGQSGTLARHPRSLPLPLPPSPRLALDLVDCAALVKVKVAQSCPTLCNPVDYTVRGILQARILEWVAFPFSRGSSQLRDQTQVSHIAGVFFTS